MKKYKGFEYPDRSEIYEILSKANESGVQSPVVYIHGNNMSFGTIISIEDLEKVSDDELEQMYKEFIDKIHNMVRGEVVVDSLGHLSIDGNLEKMLSDDTIGYTESIDEVLYDHDRISSRAARRHSDRFEATRYKRKRNNDKKYF